MKKFIIVLANISAVIAIIIATLPMYKLAFIPGSFALALSILSLFWNKTQLKPKKNAELGILLSALALILSTYKIIFTSSEVGDTTDLEQKEAQSQEDAIEALDSLDIELPED